MGVLYVTEPNDEGMVAAITDEPCERCGWPETILHIKTDGATKRGCAGCETEGDI